MRDEKEERKKQVTSNKQTRQSNTAHPRQSLFLEKISCPYMYMYMCTWVRVPPVAVRISDCLWCAVLLYLVVCLTLLASFVLLSSLIKTCTCTCGRYQKLSSILSKGKHLSVKNSPWSWLVFKLSVCSICLG